MDYDADALGSTLSADQVRQYHREGYLGPVDLCSPEEMDEYRVRVESECLARDPQFTSSGNRMASRHVDCEVVREMVGLEPLAAAARGIFGPDLLLWNTQLWNKLPGDPALPWHQDVASWAIEPWLTLSAWLAIDPVDVQNGCVRVVPRSHRQMLQLAPARYDTAGTPFTGHYSDSGVVNDEQAVSMELRPGQFFFFNERLVHGAWPNVSDRRRLGMSIRITTPIAHLAQDGSIDLAVGHRAMLLSGVDRFHWNHMIDDESVYAESRG